MNIKNTISSKKKEFNVLDSQNLLTEVLFDPVLYPWLNEQCPKWLKSEGGMPPVAVAARRVSTNDIWMPPLRHPNEGISIGHIRHPDERIFRSSTARPSFGSFVPYMFSRRTIVTVCCCPSSYLAGVLQIKFTSFSWTGYSLTVMVTHTRRVRKT